LEENTYGTSYQTNGLAINNDKITAYYGGFTKNVTVFSSKNLIAAESITTPLRKKDGGHCLL
jgi:hypothetical protein